jgi:hypothetical protein
MDELEGKECAVEFNLPYNDWPITGHPARVFVRKVDMPMVKLEASWGSTTMWVNVAIIKTIRLWPW